MYVKDFKNLLLCFVHSVEKKNKKKCIKEHSSTILTTQENSNERKKKRNEKKNTILDKSILWTLIKPQNVDIYPQPCFYCSPYLTQRPFITLSPTLFVTLYVFRFVSFPSLDHSFLFNFDIIRRSHTYTTHLSLSVRFSVCAYAVFVGFFLSISKLSPRLFGFSTS